VGGLRTNFSAGFPICGFAKINVRISDTISITSVEVAVSLQVPMARQQPVLGAAESALPREQSGDSG